MQLDNFMKIDIENSLLSLFMYENDDFYKYETGPELFTDLRVHIFSGIRELISTGKTADIVTLSEHLKGRIKTTEIVELADTPISLNPDYHIEILEKARIRREMYNACLNALELCKSGAEPHEIEAAIKSKITNIELSEPSDSTAMVTEMVDDLEKEARGDREYGIKTGLRRLDYLLNGFVGGEFLVIAARPGSGKTSLALNMARHFGFSRIPGLIFSLEMPKKSLVRRMAADVGSIDEKYLLHGHLKTGNREIWDRVNEAADSISQMPILWDDTASMTIDKIYSRAKKAKTLHGIKWVIVDYLQLITGWGGQGQEPKAEITRQIKIMAKELDIVMVVLSQLNRNIESRQKRTPVMSDLRDAGSIEQDCDFAIFPDVPEKKQDGTQGDEYETADLYIVKARRGRVGKIPLMKWQGHFYRFSDNSVSYSQ